MKKLHETIRNILIIQLGDIGDVVWATPALWAMKNGYPGAKVSVLVREDFGQLLEKDPSLYKVFEVRRYHGSLFKRVLEQIGFIKELRRERFDLVIDLRSDERGAYMAYVTGAPVRVSQPYPDVPFWRNLLFTHLISPPPQPEKTRGAAEQSLRLLRAMGITADQTVPRLWVSEDARLRIRDLLLNLEIIGDDRRWITLNPFSRWPYKEWASDRWASVIDWLREDFGLVTVIVGAKGEREKADNLVSQCKGLPFNLAGSTTLSELAAVLALSHLHVGVDSAAPHIAAAVGTPTVTIYGPSDWEDWAPVGEKHRVIIPDLDCVPCYKKGCEGKGWSRCLEELEVDTVKKGIRDALKGIADHS